MSAMSRVRWKDLPALFLVVCIHLAVAGLTRGVGNYTFFYLSHHEFDNLKEEQLRSKDLINIANEGSN